MSDVNSTFSYNANFGPASAQVRAFTKDITSLNAAFLTLDKTASQRKYSLAQGFAKDLNALGGFKSQLVDLTSDVERFGKALQKNQLTLRQYYKEASQAYKKNSMARRLAEDEVRRAQSQLLGLGSDARGRKQGMLITPMTIDTSDINTKMAIAQKQFSIFNKLVADGSTQLVNWGKNTQWAGRQLTVGLTVPLTIFGATVSRTFREVDKELTRFAKVYGSDLVSANQQATNAMRAQVEQLSKDFAGKYGIAARETAGLAADLAATGLEGQKLLDSVAQTTRLAVLGEVDRQEAMKATLALQNAFNMSTTELADSINFLNAVENQTSASLQDLTEAIPRVGPVINALGGDVKDLAVLLVAMKEGGVNAAEGANAIKSGLASLINPTKQASETARQYGIDLNGIVKANKGQLMPTILAFQQSLKNLDEFARAQIIEQLFGKYQFARISALFDNLNASGSQTIEVMKLMNSSSQDLAATANNEIRTLTESSSMRFQRSMEAIKASLLPVGEVLTNAVIPFLEKTATLINTIVEYGRNLPEPVKNFLKLGVGITAIAGPIIMLVGVFANFLGYLTKSAMMFTRLGAAMMGIRTEKFELLDDNQLAAARSSEILAQSYDNQTSSIGRLNAALATYIANLRETQRIQPNIFSTGAPSAGRGKSAKKLQSGGSAWVPGTGSGDRVPAMLEPGEFVVNRNAAKQYGGFLNHINFTAAPRFQKGGSRKSGASASDAGEKRTVEQQWLAEMGSRGTLEMSAAKAAQKAVEKKINSQAFLDMFNGGMPWDKTSGVYKDLINLERSHIVTGLNKLDKMSWRSDLWIPETGSENRLYQIIGNSPKKNFAKYAQFREQLGLPDTAQKAIKDGRGVPLSALSDHRAVLQLMIKDAQKNPSGYSPKFLKYAIPASAGIEARIPTYSGIDLEKRSAQIKSGAETFVRVNPSITNIPEKPQEARTATGKKLTQGEKKKHARGPIVRTAGRKPQYYQMTLGETIADLNFVKFAQEGLGDESNLKAQRRAVRGQKAGAIGGLAMTGAFMLPALTGTNEALNGFTSALTNAMMALSVLTTIAQIRGIGGGGMGIGARARGLKGAIGTQGRTATGQFMSREATLAAAKQNVGAGRVMGGIATKAAGTGRGAMVARGALGALGLVGSASMMIPLAVIAAGVAAFALYQKSINNARKEGAAMYAEQTKAAEYYGIELKNINTAMAENAKIAKEMGFAKTPTAATVDPALKKAILDQEENKKLVEQIKESNDPASIFLGQYGKMLQQGFTPEQAKEVLSILAQASGKMGTLTMMSSQLSGITTAQQATSAVGRSFTQNVGALYGERGVSSKDLARVEGAFTGLIESALTSSDLSDGFKIIEEGIAAAYAEGSNKGLSEREIGKNLNKSIESQLKTMGFEEGDPIFEAINSLGNSLEDTQNKALLVQAAAAGIDLTNFLADGKLAQEELKQIQSELAATDALAEINLKINADIQGAMDAIDTEVQARTAYYDQLIADNESAQEAENERTKNFQRNMEKRNKALQKEIKGIQRSADETIKAKEKEIDSLEKSTKAYVDSLQSKKEEDTFFSQQAQTALGGLGALAGGDIIGFLAAREQMAADANAYSQQNEIDRIQEIADAEVERLQEVIDKVKEKTDEQVQSLQDQLDANQELMDGEGERHEKRMANLAKEAQQIQIDKAAELGRLNDTKAKLQELMNLPVGEKLGKDLSAYANSISEVANNMPKSAQDTMKKLATSFGDNFQSVFDAELQRSASEYGVNPAQLKELVKKALPKISSGSDRKNREGGYATGGYVTGPGSGTSDSIPAMLSNGEYVVKADSVRRIGKSTLDKINNGYRTGGDEAPGNAAAFAAGVQTAVLAASATNALTAAAASAMNEEPGNSDGLGTGAPSSIPEKLGKVARILRGNYRITARGTYPSGNKHSARYGTAIDYATPIGTGVYAMASGTAANLSKGNTSFGKYVTIRHADGTESLYAHLDGYGSRGGTVNAGDLIGYTGNSGNSTGPHLHFEWSALQEGFNPPGMRIGGETMSDGIAKLHKGEMVLTKPLTQTLKKGISDMRVGVPAMASGYGAGSGGTIVTDNRVINVNVNATGSGMNPDIVAQKIVSAIGREENRRGFGRST